MVHATHLNDARDCETRLLHSVRAPMPATSTASREPNIAHPPRSLNVISAWLRQCGKLEKPASHSYAHCVVVPTNRACAGVTGHSEQPERFASGTEPSGHERHDAAPPDDTVPLGHVAHLLLANVGGGDSEDDGGDSEDGDTDDGTDSIAAEAPPAAVAERKVPAGHGTHPVAGPVGGDTKPACRGRAQWT
jgi:hypothetical protein